jgi:hypothetical protein
MPKIFEQNGYVFHFYSADLDEPIHVHIRKEGKEAKFWVNPVSLERAGRFNDHELNQIERILRKRINDIIAAWNRQAGQR